LKAATSPDRNWHKFNILFFGEALTCPYKKHVNYKFLVDNENTLRYICAKLNENYIIVFERNRKTDNISVFTIP